MWKIAIALTLICVALSASLACSSKSQEDTAIEVAQEWTDDSIENVSDDVVQLLLGQFPSIGGIAGDILADQVKEMVDWDYQAIGSEGDNTYRIVATASVSLEISLPVVEDREYEISLPFDLWVDTKGLTVERWDPKLTSASIEEKKS